MNIRKQSKILFGLFLLFIGFAIILGVKINNTKYEHQEEEKIISFLEESSTLDAVKEDDSFQEKIVENAVKEERYIAIMEIPKINLKKGLYDINDSKNNVDKNIKILEDSTMPNVKHGNFILAGHSGIGRTAYFSKLKQLQIGDSTYIYYRGKKYTYQVSDIYEIEKSGIASIKRKIDATTLTMITCRYGTNKQTIIISYLVAEEKY